MLRFVQSDLFSSPAQTLVNTVNTVGVMGKGIAKQFKDRHPIMFNEYAALCKRHELVIGSLHIWRSQNRWILNFPTKTTWRKPSKIDHLERGLYTFRKCYADLGIRSVSFPPLGCGNGELDWQEVKPLMVQYLHNLDIPVWIHELFFTPSFRSEQRDLLAIMPPKTFEEFVGDFRSAITDKCGQFKVWHNGPPYRAEINQANELNVFVNNKLVLDEDFLAIGWVGLRLGVLTSDYFGCGVNSAGNYILPILKELPYVREVTFGEQRQTDTFETGLMFNQTIDTFDNRTTASMA